MLWSSDTTTCWASLRSAQGSVSRDDAPTPVDVVARVEQEARTLLVVAGQERQVDGDRENLGLSGRKVPRLREAGQLLILLGQSPWRTAHVDLGHLLAGGLSAVLDPDPNRSCRFGSG